MANRYKFNSNGMDFDVLEVEFDAELHAFEFWTGGNLYLGSVYPATLEDMAAIIADLEAGVDPFDEGWEDGRGNSLTPDGWGVTQATSKDELYDRLWPEEDGRGDFIIRFAGLQDFGYPLEQQDEPTGWDEAEIIDAAIDAAYDFIQTGETKPEYLI